MSIEQVITPEMQKEKILEYIGVIGDGAIPHYLRVIYVHKCEIILTHYTGNDYNDLWNIYLTEKGRMK